MDKLNLKEVTKRHQKEGYDMHDNIRAGLSVELDPYKVALALKAIEQKINEIIGGEK